MNKTLRDFVPAVMAGICIAVGGTVYLSLDNKVIGAFLFTVGLFSICVNGFNLFTGKVGYALQNPPSYLLYLVNVWLGNLVGTCLAAALLACTRVGAALQDKAAALCEVKLNDSAISVFVLAIFCNLLMYIAVDGFKNNGHEIGKYLGLFLGVVVFILCGFEHCVANMFYFSMAGVWNMHTFVWLLIMTGGNIIGGLLIPLARKSQ